MDFFDYDFNITQLVFAAKVPAGTGHMVHNNRPSHGLVLNTEGRKRYIFDDGTELAVGKNDVLFLPEGSSYTVKDEIKGDCYALNFKITERIKLPPFAMHTKNGEKLSEMFRSAEKTFKAKHSGYMLKCRAELYSAIYTVVREKNAEYLDGTKKNILLPAVEYIHNSYTDGIGGIDCLADLCGISETYFRRLFVKCYGMPPLSYINKLRIARAKELLSQSEATLELTAEASGFADASYFSRYFKKTVGMTPAEYRKYAQKFGL